MCIVYFIVALQNNICLCYTMSEIVEPAKPIPPPEKKKEDNAYDSIMKAAEAPLPYLNNVIRFVLHPVVLSIIIFVLIIVIYLGGGGVITVILTVSLIVYLTFIIVQLITNYKVTANLKSLFSTKPTLDLQVSKGSELDKDKNRAINFINKSKKEVFNIPGNYYTYDNARVMCKAMNAELATYDQVESSYNNGGEWCNYGWSDGQMALFPIQKKTYNKLQTIKGHEKDCGRPGVNGGYFEDAELKFGVNCYGVKPNINDPSEKIMDNLTFFPQNEKDLEMKKQIDHLKDKMKDIIISPFHQTKWRQY